MSSKKKKKSSFQCKFCEVCLTNGGLKKHVTKKHSSSIRRFRKVRLQIVLKGFFEKNVCKLAQDDCYLDGTLPQGPSE